MKAGFAVYLSLLILTVSSLARGDPAEYVLTDYCGETIYVDSAALLTINGYWDYSYDCAVTIKATHAETDNQVRLELLSFQADCTSNWVDLYNGNTFYRTLQSLNADMLNIAERMCGQRTWSTMYLTDYDTLQVKIFASNDWVTPVTATMLATSTSGTYSGDDFICDNDLYVDESLQCDGYNNCGDWSDENSDLCGDDDDTDDYSPEVIVIAGVVVGSFLFILLVIVIVGKRLRRRRQIDEVARQTAISRPDYPPSYGSINGGYMPPPPPYNAEVMPPPPALQRATQPSRAAPQFPSVSFVFKVLISGCDTGTGEAVDPLKDDLSSYCSKNLTIYPSAVLKLNESRNNTICRVDVRAGHAQTNNQVRLELMSLNCVSGGNWVQLYTITKGHIQMKLSGRLCGNITESFMYLTSTDTLRIEIHTGVMRGRSLSAGMLATSTSMVRSSGDFKCDDNWYIDETLECDGYYNCDDWSDEDEDLCDIWTHDASIIIGVSVNCIVVVVVVIAVLIWTRHRRRRNEQAD
ncbi:hypothetical protein BaRGS_00004081, partial [Batillaria attramentaria]